MSDFGLTFGASHVIDILEKPGPDAETVLRRSGIPAHYADEVCRERFGRTFTQQRDLMLERARYSMRRTVFMANNVYGAGSTGFHPLREWENTNGAYSS